MKLPRDEFETKFREYRDALRKEIGRFRDAASILRQVNERTQDYLDELNLAPAFFQTVRAALFTTTILWADKMFDENGERGLFNFLALIENNRDWMTLKELQRRKEFPDDHWLLREKRQEPPITFESIEQDRQRIRRLAALPSITILRNKYQAHFDKDYFFDLSKLNVEAPIDWAGLAEVGSVMTTMLSNYSADFDGEMISGEAIGIDDLTRLLHAARKGSGR